MVEWTDLPSQTTEAGFLFSILAKGSACQLRGRTVRIDRLRGALAVGLIAAVSFFHGPVDPDPRRSSPR